MMFTITTEELRELVRRSGHGRRFTIDRLEPGALIVAVKDPVRATVRLDDFKLHPREISARLNLSWPLRKTIAFFLRRKNVENVRIDGDRIHFRLPQKLLQMGELHDIRITAEELIVQAQLRIPQN
ncbi:MAG: hypothetical protein MAG453_00957 [Calditrichaeota bacterium]|nr:hypothetical protein [Calditrichota bacterium]